jgi:multidrug efflux pump subunit AcrA (membrane-fusion protein)
VEQAQAAVDQAQANLDLINAQIAKLAVYAPIDGVILVRNVEPGEFIQPGATALTMADLSDITITVYVPEDRYGETSLKPPRSVDSFPSYLQPPLSTLRIRPNSPRATFKLWKDAVPPSTPSS